MVMIKNHIKNSVSVITLIPHFINSLSQSSKLLLDTSSVTTSEKTFTLEDDYTNYKELYFEIEMNYTSSSNIALFTNIIRVDTIRKDTKYTVYRTSAGGSVEAALNIWFVSDNNTDVIKISKTSATFNGCRRLRIFGVN